MKENVIEFDTFGERGFDFDNCIYHIVIDGNISCNAAA